MTKTLRCSIVTPSESVFDGEVTYVSYQAWDGQQGIMVEQSPILAKLGIGSLRLDLPGVRLSNRTSRARTSDGIRREVGTDDVPAITGAPRVATAPDVVAVQSQFGRQGAPHERTRRGTNPWPLGDGPPS